MPAPTDLAIRLRLPETRENAIESVKAALAGGSISTAAVALGLGRRTLYDLLSRDEGLRKECGLPHLGKGSKVAE